MKTATLVKDNLSGFTGHAALYKLSEPVSYDYDWEKEEFKEKTIFVIASTAFALGMETYLFPASEEGKILDWAELDGSRKGTTSHGKVLSAAGYNLI